MACKCQRHIDWSNKKNQVIYQIHWLDFEWFLYDKRIKKKKMMNQNLLMNRLREREPETVANINEWMKKISQIFYDVDHNANSIGIQHYS